LNEQDSIFELIRTGNTELVREWVAASPGIAADRDPNGISAVLYAQYRSNPEILEILLAADPPLDVFDAAAIGRSDVVLNALRDEPGAAQAWSADGFTALHLAAYFGHPETVELLIAHGADVRAVARNPMLLTALHSAVAARRPAIAATLLEHGADPNAVQAGGWTPLHAAAHQGDLPLVEMLLTHGADRFAKSDDGRDALAMATVKNHAPVIERLHVH
jgi:ankyrin repeat protein